MGRDKERERKFTQPITIEPNLNSQFVENLCHSCKVRCFQVWGSSNEKQP